MLHKHAHPCVLAWVPHWRNGISFGAWMENYTIQKNLSWKTYVHFSTKSHPCHYFRWRRDDRFEGQTYDRRTWDRKYPNRHPENRLKTAHASTPWLHLPMPVCQSYWCRQMNLRVAKPDNVCDVIVARELMRSYTLSEANLQRKKCIELKIPTKVRYDIAIKIPIIRATIFSASCANTNNCRLSIKQYWS